MAKSVKGIRETYYHDIIADYRKRSEKSFLYRAFWADNVKALLKECLPPLPKKKELGRMLKELDENFLRHLEDDLRSRVNLKSRKMTICHG